MGKFCLSIDETTDSEGHYVAIIVIGILETNTPAQIFILTSKDLEAVNHIQTCKLLEKSICLLWPNGVRNENVFLFLTYTSPYMAKLAKFIN